MYLRLILHKNNFNYDYTMERGYARCDNEIYRSG